MKKIVSLLAVLVTFFGTAQIVEPVKWSSSIVKVSDSEIDLIITANIENNWHLYSQFTPEGGALPLVFTFKNQKGNYQLIGKTKEGKYKKSFNEIFEIEEYYFQNTAKFTQRIKIINSKLKTVDVSLDGQACIDGKCVQTEANLKFNLPELKVSETTETVIDSAAKNTDSVATSEADTTKQTVTTVKDSNNATPEKEEKKNGLLLFFATLLAGILVTFTPCVFPMIPMTVSFFLKQSADGDKKKGRFNALMYGFFIVLIYVLISLPFHIFEGISEDVFYEVSTNPYLNLFFFAVFTIFAISFLGAFEITMPSSLANKVDNASNRGGLLGIFFMALTLIIVSFSCTGPALGLVIGGALSTDGGATLLTIAMLGFGLGLAFPFMIFALFPSMMGNLPKSGGWLNTVKVVFGFIELALAFKFFSMADLVMKWHILERETFIAIWIALFTGLALYLFGKLTLPHDSPLSNISVGRLLLGISSLTFAIYLIPGLWGAPLNIISGFPPPMSYSESPNGVGSKNSIEVASNSRESLPEHAQYGPSKIVTFHNYDEGLAYAKKVNKPVMIDFTGITCVNCRRMEELVWSKPEILSIIKNEVVLISLYVDDRKKLPADKIYTTKSGKEITTYGKKWSDLAITKYKANVQPYYVLMAHDESNLNEPVGYNSNIEEYKKWLEDGIAKFKK
jgi:thiol:disulfide interchange protein DsbD